MILGFSVVIPFALDEHTQAYPQIIKGWNLLYMFMLSLVFVYTQFDYTNNA